MVFRASIYDGSGYADEARGIIFGLFRAGFPVRVEPFGLQYDAQNLLNAEEQEILESLKHQRVDLACGIHFQHYPANDFNLAMRGRYRVGRTMYETDSIPDGWRDCCEGMDEVWVPGSFQLRDICGRRRLAKAATRASRRHQHGAFPPWGGAVSHTQAARI